MGEPGGLLSMGSHRVAEGGCGAEAAGGLAPGETAAGSGLGARAEAAGGVAPSETAAGSGLRARAEAAGGAAPGETAAGRSSTFLI